MTVPLSVYGDVDVAAGFVPGNAIATFRAEGSNFASFVAWDYGGSVTSGVFAIQGPTAPIVATTRQPVRVTYHWGIGRYVAAWVDGTRLLRVAVSKSSSGTDWNLGEVVTWTDLGGHVSMADFDIHCPTRQLLSQSCRVVFHDAVLQQNAQDALRRSMRVAVGSFTVTLAGQTGASIGAASFHFSDVSAPQLVSLSDYGLYAPAGAFQGPGWLLSTSRFSPIPIVANTDLRFSAIQPAIMTGVMDAKPTVAPIGGATPSQYGGLSCDFVPWARRFVCVGFQGGPGW